MFKDFINWIQYKIHLNTRSKSPKFKEGEIWWCSFGVNIGIETDGKNEKFNRPVLILKKFNHSQFFGLPLTSKEKTDSNFYFELELKNKNSWICLTQMRVMDSKRLQDYYTKVNQLLFEQIKKRFIKLLE